MYCKACLQYSWACGGGRGLHQPVCALGLCSKFPNWQIGSISTFMHCTCLTRDFRTRYITCFPDMSEAIVIGLVYISAAASKLETTTLLKSVPSTTGFFHSSQDNHKDPYYSPHKTSQQAALGVCNPSTPCTQRSAQKQLATKTPRSCSWGLHDPPRCNRRKSCWECFSTVNRIIVNRNQVSIAVTKLLDTIFEKCNFLNVF